MTRKARKASCGAALRVLHALDEEVASFIAGDDECVAQASMREPRAAPPEAPMAGERPKIFFSV